jgi:hypothetical protein
VFGLGYNHQISQEWLTKIGHLQTLNKNKARTTSPLPTTSITLKQQTEPDAAAPVWPWLAAVFVGVSGIAALLKSRVQGQRPAINLPQLNNPIGRNMVGPNPTIPAAVKQHITTIRTVHPKVDKQRRWQQIPSANRMTHISHFIRRSNNDPTPFLKSCEDNEHQDGRVKEIRPATAVGILKDDKGIQIRRDSDAQPVGIGLLGDAFHAISAAGDSIPGNWSEKGEVILKNNTVMLSAQKCDISSGKIQLKPNPGGIDPQQFKNEMARRARPTHIEGKWMDSMMDLYTKLSHQAEKAVKGRRMGSRNKVGNGRRPGKPKNSYSNYKRSYEMYGLVPHNEAFMVPTLDDIQAIGVNTHSKQAVANSYELYVNTINYFKSKGRDASQIQLAMYNNRTGEVKTVYPDDLEWIYENAPDQYTIDHSKVHVDELAIP